MIGNSQITWIRKYRYKFSAYNPPNLRGHIIIPNYSFLGIIQCWFLLRRLHYHWFAGAVAAASWLFSPLSQCWPLELENKQAVAATEAEGAVVTAACTACRAWAAWPCSLYTISQTWSQPDPVGAAQHRPDRATQNFGATGQWAHLQLKLAPGKARSREISQQLIIQVQQPLQPVISKAYCSWEQSTRPGSNFTVWVKIMFCLLSRLSASKYRVLICNKKIPFGIQIAELGWQSLFGVPLILVSHIVSESKHRNGKSWIVPNSMYYQSCFLGCRPKLRKDNCKF